ncbi:MAG: hypothetical protein B6I24_03870 [Bacteroidetes bacterium 4572_128]|nr:MAG: hypothetical protein B6I24_03870 [Bacteroidetes bacterium 4572_128]
MRCKCKLIFLNTKKKTTFFEKKFFSLKIRFSFNFWKISLKKTRNFTNYYFKLLKFLIKNFNNYIFKFFLIKITIFIIIFSLF